MKDFPYAEGAVPPIGGILGVREFTAPNGRWMQSPSGLISLPAYSIILDSHWPSRGDLRSLRFLSFFLLEILSVTLSRNEAQ
jgi:hypothetical protein